MPSVPWGVAQDSPGHPRLSRARGHNAPLLAKVQSDPGSHFKGSHHGAKTRNKLAGSMHGELSRSHVGGALHDRAAHCHTLSHDAECLCPHRAPVCTSDSGWGLATNPLPRRLLFATAVILLTVGATVPADIDRNTATDPHLPLARNAHSCCLPLAKLMPRMLLPLATSTATALGAMEQTCYHGSCLLTDW